MQFANLTTVDPALPDFNPHGRQENGFFQAVLHRVYRSLRGEAVVSDPDTLGEEWSWVVLFKDGTVLAEIDGIGWSQHIEAHGIHANVDVLALVGTGSRERVFVMGVPEGFGAFFRRRRAGLVGGPMGHLATIIGAVPLEGTTRAAGYFFVDMLENTFASTDLNAI